MRGILFILAGIVSIIYMYKNPNKTFIGQNIGGYIGGFFLILIGVLLIMGKIHW
jgi:uncharacterized membrane protein HdeD (DUF308 family)